MTLKDDSELRDRLRQQSSAQSSRPLIDDFRRGQQRSFPGVGLTQPVRPTSFSKPVLPPSRPRRPQYQRPPRPDVAEPETLLLEAETPDSFLSAQATPELSKRARTKTSHRSGWPTFKRVLLMVMLLGMAGAGWFGYKFVSSAQAVFHGSVFSLLTTTKLKGEDTGRVNILLAGNSADDPYHDGAELTDSIMIASVDVQHHTAFMISVPRDLWVDIPGYGHAKINEAYVDGENNGFSAPGYPNGGMGLLEEVIYQTFGVKANYYALVNYNAMRDAVNAVGGVDFTVKSDDPRGLYDPGRDYATHTVLVKLSNGTHHLNGAQALDLARARGDDPGSYGYPLADFNRTQNQRELILDLKTKVLSVSTLANPVTDSQLFDSIGKNVRTDFTLGEVRRLYDIGKGIPNSSIQSIGLNDVAGKDYMSNYRSPTGQSALIPAAGLDDYSDIRAYITRLLSSDPVVREDARVVVLNGTGTSGLAAKAQTALTAKHLNIVAIGDASVTAPTSTIIDASNGAMPGTLSLLEQLYGIHVTKANPYANVYDADFIVILGNDQVKPAATQQQ